MLLRRRRPLMRAAAVGGTAYAVGRHAANRSNQENEQEARLNELEQQQAAGAKGGVAAPPSSVTPDITTRLNELNNMKAQGLLTDAEFAAAKQKLLGS